MLLYISARLLWYIILHGFMNELIKHKQRPVNYMPDHHYTVGHNIVLGGTVGLQSLLEDGVTGN